MTPLPPGLPEHHSCDGDSFEQISFENGIVGWTTYARRAGAGLSLQSSTEQSIDGQSSMCLTVNSVAGGAMVKVIVPVPGVAYTFSCQVLAVDVPEQVQLAVLCDQSKPHTLSPLGDPAKKGEWQRLTAVCDPVAPGQPFVTLRLHAGTNGFEGGRLATPAKVCIDDLRICSTKAPSPPPPSPPPRSPPVSPPPPPSPPLYPSCVEIQPEVPFGYVGKPYQWPRCYLDAKGEQHCVVLPEGQTVCDPSVQRRLAKHWNASVAA